MRISRKHPASLRRIHILHQLVHFERLTFNPGQRRLFIRICSTSWATLLGLGPHQDPARAHLPYLPSTHKHTWSQASMAVQDELNTRCVALIPSLVPLLTSNLLQKIYHHHSTTTAGTHSIHTPRSHRNPRTPAPMPCSCRLKRPACPALAALPRSRFHQRPLADYARLMDAHLQI